MWYSHDFAIWAKSFGALISENITKRTTHVIASPLRKTAKVRQAAKKPEKIKIVSQDWLFGCLSQWRKIDEAPYRLHADLENENTDNATNGQGSPFDGPDQNAQLSSSDEEAAVTEEEEDLDTAGIENDADALDEAEMQKYAPTLPREASSLHEETEADWDDWTAELNDFMEGESLDSESEMDNTETESESLPSSAKKRKRNEDGLSADTDDSDSSTSGSRLQRRKKKALARTTSLVSVSAANDPQSAKIDTHSNGQQDPTNKGSDKPIEDPEDDPDLDLEAQLEAEMLRQAEEDGDA